MKKMIMLAAAAVMALGASAQRASDSELSYNEHPSGYNRIGLSYINQHYGFNWDSDDNFSTNGVGIDYIHGFGLSSSLPIYIETGLSFNMGFYSESESNSTSTYSWKGTTKFQNMNFQVPVNVAYRFNCGDNFAITPYLGINFKINAVSKKKYDAEYTYNGNTEKENGEWYSFYKKEDSDDSTWNRFQMGWQVGVGAQYSNLYLGLQFGTDFIPTYSEKYDNETFRISNSTFKVQLGYCF